jgi:DNA-binding MarR family transcriptional regulator
VEGLFDLILNSGFRPPLFDPDIQALDRGMPRSELLAVLLLQRRGEVTMSELAADLGAPLSTATGIGGRLARRGLAKRDRDSDDRRVICVRLTAKGRALASRLRKHVDGVVQRVQKALTEEELAQLLLLAQKVAKIFQTPTPASTTTPGFRRIPIEE